MLESSSKSLSRYQTQQPRKLNMAYVDGLSRRQPGLSQGRLKGRRPGMSRRLLLAAAGLEPGKAQGSETRDESTASPGGSRAWAREGPRVGD